VASLLLAGGVLAVLVAVVAVLPPRFTAHRDFNTTAEELKAQNDVRATLLQALAGGVLLLGAYVTYRQLRVTREGQITDRYTKAVDQLGSEHLDVRVGGIYALERIARDSPPDRATIEEVLTAYVRDHAPWPPPPAAPSLQAIAARLVTFAQRRRRSGRPRRGADDAAGPAPVGRLGTEAAPPRPAADVRAAIAVLGRRELPPDGLRRLYLARLDLRGAFLLGANLQDADLTDANLQDANLSDANLQDANLGGVNLQRADLVRADIRGAWLDDADLQGADLTGANLRGANLRGVNLQGGFLADADLQRAGLRGAHLQGAVLADANLQGAGLGGAELQGARLLGADLQGAGLGGANLQGADLERANLQGARADEGTRWPDDWKRETAKARGVEYLD
jgi:uncharacterized protein YjbI with pentapeptide repeats